MDEYTWVSGIALASSKDVPGTFSSKTDNRDDRNAQQHEKIDEQNKLRNVLTDEVKGMPVLLFLHFKISFLLSELIM
ncbi:hypothetical protein [Hominenteromicrobium sp.]|uniref:hypothetical protein n=1 Tax=Hominenteromicrobium sp. TaxID=3073581 RepID=UPI00399A55AB